MISTNTQTPYLEMLSTAELVTLAKHFNVDIPEGMDRVFIIDELLEYAPCLNIYQEDVPFEKTDLVLDHNHSEEIPEPVELPKQYNFTYIEVLIRDPLWVYVFWEIRNMEKKQLEKSPSFNGYYLKVTLFDCKICNDVSTLFTIPVSPQDSSWYLNFPPEGPSRQICKFRTDCAFQVQLCANVDKEEKFIASSDPFTLPKILAIPGENDLDLRDNPLICMSGLDDLPVIRDGERASRIPLPNSSC